MPESFWGDCILHAVYIINRLPSTALDNNIPYQILFGKVPQYQHLRVFGCLAFAMIPSCQRSKLSPGARKCMFLGFANGVKGYKLHDLQTKEIFLSRDVSFYENSFPFQDNHDELNDEASLKTDIVLPSEGVIYSDNEEQVQDTIISPESHQQNQEDTDIQTQSVPSVQEWEPIAESAIEPQPRRSTRIRTIPTYLSDYACQNTTVRRTSPHIISNVLSYNSLSHKYRAFAVNALVAKEPKTYNEICKRQMTNEQRGDRAAMEKNCGGQDDFSQATADRTDGAHNHHEQAAVEMDSFSELSPTVMDGDGATVTVFLSAAPEEESNKDVVSQQVVALNV
nr:Retrovirus-related Pol polyprotein from transposon TNT 1-94 [Ipomoea batatas]